MFLIPPIIKIACGRNLSGKTFIFQSVSYFKGYCCCNGISVWVKNNSILKVFRFLCLVNPPTAKSVPYFLESEVVWKENFSQIYVTNNYNTFLILLWKLESSSRAFYDFGKIAVYFYLKMIISRCHLPFLVFEEHTVKKVKNHKRIIIYF